MKKMSKKNGVLYTKILVAVALLVILIFAYYYSSDSSPFSQASFTPDMNGLSASGDATPPSPEGTDDDCDACSRLRSLEVDVENIWDFVNDLHTAVNSELERIEDRIDGIENQLNASPTP